MYFFLRPKMVAAQKFDEETAEKNHRLIIELSKLETQKESLYKEIQNLQESNRIYLENVKNSNQEEISLHLSLLADTFDRAVEAKANEFQNAEDEYQTQYLLTLKECAKDVEDILYQKKEELEKLNVEIEDLRARVSASVADRKRALEMETSKDFYRLVLLDSDIEEIKQIRGILPYLKNKEPLNKVIYKCYYEKPYTDLIGRVIGNKSITGIYKITNIENGMCYVGQAVNVGR